MTVRIRMKKLGRKHRPFFRICAVDIRRPRDGKVIEELGTYDPLVGDVDARAVLDTERIDYWLGVGAQPSDKVRVLIKKYGSQGTRRAEAEAARARLGERKPVPPAPEPVVPFVPRAKGKKAAAAAPSPPAVESSVAPESDVAQAPAAEEKAASEPAE